MRDLVLSWLLDALSRFGYEIPMNFEKNLMRCVDFLVRTRVHVTPEIVTEFVVKVDAAHVNSTLRRPLTGLPAGPLSLRSLREAMNGRQ